MEVKLVLSSSSTSSSFSSLFIFVVIVSSLSFLFFFFFAFIYVFFIIIILLLLLSLSPFCYLCSSIFVDSFLADVDECTSSTAVCSIHFNCINTLSSYRCDHNHSCQGKKSMNYLFFFLFLIGQLNSFEAR